MDFFRSIAECFSSVASSRMDFGWFFGSLLAYRCHNAREARQNASKEVAETNNGSHTRHVLESCNFRIAFIVASAISTLGSYEVAQVGKYICREGTVFNLSDMLASRSTYIAVGGGINDHGRFLKI